MAGYTRWLMKFHMVADFRKMQRDATRDSVRLRSSGLDQGGRVRAFVNVLA
jgi:hypothetical protein